MQSPCCVGVVRNSADLVGVEEVLAGDLPAYVSATAGSVVGVLVVHDIFGYSIPNCKYIADHCSKTAGFTAIMPDFYRGDNWPATEFDADSMDSDKFGPWFGSKMTAEFWQQFNVDVATSLDKLRALGCTQFAVIGFCWVSPAVPQGFPPQSDDLRTSGWQGGVRRSQEPGIPRLRVAARRRPYARGRLRVPWREPLYHGERASRLAGCRVRPADVLPACSMARMLIKLMCIG